MIFPVSGVEAPIWMPPLTAFAISFFTSMAGVSGAFLLLPFQVTVLGFTSPAVTPTNLLFNIVGIPGGVYRYFREGRMVWPLAWNIIVGTLPGLFIGGIIRIKVLPDPERFKFFIGLVLIYIGARMLLNVLGGGERKGDATRPPAAPVHEEAPLASSHNAVQVVSWSLSKTEYTFEGSTHSFHTLGLFTISLVVGIVGGAYGIGGGALMAPIIVSLFGLPVHTIAGATLMGTCVTSVGGVALYSLLAVFFPGSDMAIAPDWALGLLFGVGGFFGMYLGAGVQQYVPAQHIKIGLGLIIAGLALKYILGYVL